MKKIYKILILIFVILMQINVNAEESVPITSLPKQYSYDGYEFTIEGFELRVYEIAENNAEGEDNKWMENYANNEPDITIPITDGTITISPTMTSSELHEFPTSLVDLNLNLTNEKIKELLNDKGLTPTLEKSYFSEIVVKYKLTTSKIESAHMYNVSTFRTLVNFISGSEWRDEVSLNTTISQPINVALYSYNSETNNSDLVYETTITEENDIGLFILNYLGLSIDEMSDTNDSINDILMFHSIDNIDYLIDNLNDIEDDADDVLNHPTVPSNPDKENQVVEVGNTLSTIPKYFYIISIIMITLGILIIGNVLVKE